MKVIQIASGSIIEIDADKFDAERHQMMIDALRQDGPTISEYVERGYRASNYPPKGYASKSTEAEIAAAVEAEQQAGKAKEPPATEPPVVASEPPPVVPPVTEPPATSEPPPVVATEPVVVTEPPAVVTEPPVVATAPSIERFVMKSGDNYIIVDKDGKQVVEQTFETKAKASAFLKS
jgi:hypothetical protein